MDKTTATVFIVIFYLVYVALVYRGMRLLVIPPFKIIALLVLFTFIATALCVGYLYATLAVGRDSLVQNIGPFFSLAYYILLYFSIKKLDNKQGKLP